MLTLRDLELLKTVLDAISQLPICVDELLGCSPEEYSEMQEHLQESIDAQA